MSNNQQGTPIVVYLTRGGTGATNPADARRNLQLNNVANERQFSAQNPPPYPVTSVNGMTGDVEIPVAVYGEDGAVQVPGPQGPEGPVQLVVP